MNKPIQFLCTIIPLDKPTLDMTHRAVADIKGFGLYYGIGSSHTAALHNLIDNIKDIYDYEAYDRTKPKTVLFDDTLRKGRPGHHPTYHQPGSGNDNPGSAPRVPEILP